MDAAVQNANRLVDHLAKDAQSLIKTAVAGVQEDLLAGEVEAQKAGGWNGLPRSSVWVLA